MTTNRVLVFLHPHHEDAAYLRAKRIRRRALEILDRFPDNPAVELGVASIESFAEGGGRVSWYFPSPESDDALPFNEQTTFDDVAAAVLQSLRRHIDRLTATAAAMEGEDC